MPPLTEYGWPPGPGFPDPADEFVDQIWSHLFPQLDKNSSSSGAVQPVDIHKQEAEDSQKEAEDRKNNFIRVLEAWDLEHDREKGTSKRKKGKEAVVAQVRADISQMHSWDEVFAALQGAEDVYQNSNRFRRFFRKASDKSELVVPFVDLIPSGDYTSVICGGIKFVLSACAAANRSRQEILALIEMLPEKIQISSQYTELYSSEPVLQTVTNQLYSKVLSAMEGIISYWTKDRTFEFLKPLLLHNSYRPMEKELEDVKKASERVEITLDLCDRKRLSDIARGVEVTRQSVDELKNSITQFFRAQYEQSKWYARLMIQNQSNNQPTPPKAYITLKELSQSLYDGSYLSRQSHKIDLKQVLQQGFSMQEDKLHRAGWLMAEKKVHRWLHSGRPRALQVNGNGLLERVSPMSFFCAMMVESLLPVESVIALSHFCGLGTGSNDQARNRSSGIDLIKALLLQLVVQWKFGELTCLDQEDAQTLKGSRTNLTLRFLLDIFSKLVKALPAETPLFIIIDGINYYETSELCEDTKEVIDTITQLLAEPPLLKLLITSSVRVLEVNRYFREKEKVFVPDDPSVNLMGFPDKQFDWSFRSEIGRFDRAER